MYVFLLYFYFLPSSFFFSQKETDIFGQSPAENSVIWRQGLQKGGSSCSFGAFNPSLPGDIRAGRRGQNKELIDLEGDGRHRELVLVLFVFFPGGMSTELSVMDVG